MSEMRAKRKRNRLAALRRKAPADRTIAEIRELISLASQANSFDPIKAQRKPSSK
jgi:hypothetical protein